MFDDHLEDAYNRWEEDDFEVFNQNEADDYRDEFDDQGDDE